MSLGTLGVFKQQFFDNNGNPLNGGKLYAFQAGTSTPLPIYSDAQLTTPLSQPAVADAAGRLTYYLGPATYDFELRSSAGALIDSVTNVAAYAPFNVDVDVAGVAGEALNAGDSVYLSDGSGSLTAGRWYKTDADLTYASLAPAMVGMVISSVAAAAACTVRLVGRMTSLSALTPGAAYYLSATAGAITTTQPSNGRFMGVADTATTLILAPNPASVTAYDILQIEVFT